MRTPAENAKLGGKIVFVMWLVLTWAYTISNNETTFEQKIIGGIINSLVVIGAYFISVPLQNKYIKYKEEQLKKTDALKNKNL